MVILGKCKLQENEMTGEAQMTINDSVAKRHKAN